MPSKKRRRIGYIDRAVIIENQTKKQNVADNIRAESVCGRMNSPERFFTHKLVVYSSVSDSEDEVIVDRTFFEAYVMNNEICVLVAPVFSSTVVSIDFNSSAIRSKDNISGKRKKGAFKCNAGTHICTFNFEDGTSTAVRCPIGGQLLEMNERIIESPDLVTNHRLGKGYACVMFPFTKLPTLN